MAFCSSCGNELQNDVKFCANCGNATDAAAQTTKTGGTANEVAAVTVGFLKEFFLSPATAVGNANVSTGGAIVLLALMPISMFLFLYAFLWRTITETARLMRATWWGGNPPSVRELRSEAFDELGEYFSLGSAAFETILHVAVWFVVIMLVTFLFFKFVSAGKQTTIGEMFPIFAVITFPWTIFLILGALLMFFNMSAGLGFVVVAYIPIGTISFWLLYAAAVKRTYNPSTEHIVYCGIITYILATMYSAFGMWRVAGALFGDVFGGSLIDYLF